MMMIMMIMHEIGIHMVKISILSNVNAFTVTLFSMTLVRIQLTDIWKSNFKLKVCSVQDLLAEEFNLRVLNQAWLRVVHNIRVTL